MIDCRGKVSRKKGRRKLKWSIVGDRKIEADL